LTLGSIDPYQVFRIFHEIAFYEWQTGTHADIAYVVDQAHNLKGTIEAMIQTVPMAQALYAKATLVDHERLVAAKSAADLVSAESRLQDAFAIDVRPAISEWRRARGLPDDPIDAFRRSGYLERVVAERASHAVRPSSSYA
jgi:L-rhamnose isomerase/sugar isomerase